jgi:hypothetical protein
MDGKPTPIEESVLKLDGTLFETEPTEFEKNIREARIQALEGLPQSQNLPEFMALTNAVRNLTPGHLSWAATEYGNRRPEEWIEDFTEDRDLERWTDETKKAADMLKSALTLSEQEGQIRVVITKFGEIFKDYRILAIYPRGEKAYYDIARVGVSETTEVVYSILTTGCTQQAIAQLLPKNESVFAFAMPNKALPELMSELEFDISQGSQQNFRHRDERGETIGTRDPKAYLQFAIKGGFSNETDRFLISDYYSLVKTSKDNHTKP